MKLARFDRFLYRIDFNIFSPKVTQTSSRALKIILKWGGREYNARAKGDNFSGWVYFVILFNFYLRTRPLKVTILVVKKVFVPSVVPGS